VPGNATSNGTDYTDYARPECKSIGTVMSSRATRRNKTRVEADDPRHALAARLRLIAWCKACGHQNEPDVATHGGQFLLREEGAAPSSGTRRARQRAGMGPPDREGAGSSIGRPAGTDQRARAHTLIKPAAVSGFAPLCCSRQGRSVAIHLISEDLALAQLGGGLFVPCCSFGLVAAKPAVRGSVRRLEGVRLCSNQ
jgi:hypothetical protein